MNAIDQRLSRLLRAAAQAPPRPCRTEQLPLPAVRQVLERWRISRSEGENESLVAMVLFRRGFAVACALAAVIGVISSTQGPDTETDFWTVSNAAVNLAALP